MYTLYFIIIRIIESINIFKQIFYIVKIYLSISMNNTFFKIIKIKHIKCLIEKFDILFEKTFFPICFYKVPVLKAFFIYNI